MSVFDFFKKAEEKRGGPSGRVYTDVISFEYLFNGTIGGNSYQYKLNAKTAPYTFEYETMTNDHGRMTGTADEKTVKDLSELCRRYDVLKWSDYDETDPYICDGSGFSLYITFLDGASVSAHGMNMFPDGYKAFKKEMDALFEGAVKALSAEGLRRKIEKGVSGKLESVRLCFVQKGSAGSDKYDAYFTSFQLLPVNFSLKVRSNSGEFFEKGEISINGKVPESELDLEEYDKIVKKYGLTKLMEYDEELGDHMNSEWFSMEFSYEEGRIDARGTKHPENYGSFRADLLKQLTNTAAKVKAYLSDRKE